MPPVITKDLLLSVYQSCRGYRQWHEYGYSSSVGFGNQQDSPPWQDRYGIDGNQYCWPGDIMLDDL